MLLIFLFYNDKQPEKPHVSLRRSHLTPVWPCSLQLHEEVERTADFFFFMCGNSSAHHVHSQFSLAQFHFYLPQSIPPPPSLLKLLFCFHSPRFQYSPSSPHLPFPHVTPFISPHQWFILISCLTPYNLVPALPLPYPSVPRKYI